MRKEEGCEKEVEVTKWPVKLYGTRTSTHPSTPRSTPRSTPHSTPHSTFPLTCFGRGTPRCNQKPGTDHKALGTSSHYCRCHRCGTMRAVAEEGRRKERWRGEGVSK
jgi:hypothetical protein